MMDDSRRFSKILEMVEYGDYFVINRPRQYGKTTMLRALERYLPQQGYLAVAMNFQGIDASWTVSDEAFARMFFNQLYRSFMYSDKELAAFIKEHNESTMTMDKLSDFITSFMYKVQKKVVLLIDEVDASSNYDPFLMLLAMLRTKYLNRDKLDHLTFHSIVLAGVHDIKSLNFKVRNPEDAQTNSPWNVAERLYYHTSGYPFLISKLCKNIAEKILPKKADKTIWTLDDVEASVQLLLKENNTNFDSLIKSLENNKGLYQLVYAILIDGYQIGFDANEPTIRLGQTYGCTVSKNN